MSVHVSSLLPLSRDRHTDLLLRSPLQWDVATEDFFRLSQYWKHNASFRQSTINSKYNLEKSKPSDHGGISVMSEKDISEEPMQNVGIQGPKWTEMKPLLKRNIDLIDTFIGREAEEMRNSCQPHKHIFFLKTHKTASSTVINILFRFGEFHNLTFALPRGNGTLFNYPRYFAARFVEHYSKETSGEFQIMCHHMRFLLTEVEKVMPSNTFYFTILRNPIDVMESSFSYYRTKNAFGKAKNLEDFLKNSSVFYHPNANISFYAKNFMTFDLGFDHNGIENSKHFQLTCQMVEATFNLVLITEYFDESLILLKDALCWSLDDVVAFPLNLRSNSSKVSLSLETQQKIKKWNQLDWQLYNYFNKTFWNKVETFGRERMQREVVELKRKRALLVETCLLGEGIVDPDNLHDKSMMPYQPGLAKILGYNLKQTLRKAEQLMCKRMVTPEIQYTGQLHTKQEIKKSAPKAIPSYN